MKKFLVVAFVAVATLLTSCKKDENDSIEAIQGKWLLESEIEDGVVRTLSECEKRTTLTIKGNSGEEIYYYLEERCKSNRFSVKVLKGKIIFLDGDDLEETFSVSGDKLTIEYEGDSSVYKRI